MPTLSPERRAPRSACTPGTFRMSRRSCSESTSFTLTLLRDPVDRTVSMLKHVKREFERFGGLELDEIYDDDFVFEHFVENYQTKVFAFTQEERASTIASLEPDSAVAAHLLEPQVSAGPKDRPRRIAINDQRFEQAKSNLARVDVLGLSERYGDFLDELHARYGWWPEGPKKPAQANISTESWAASPELPPANRSRQQLRHGVLRVREGAGRTAAAVAIGRRDPYPLPHAGERALGDVAASRSQPSPSRAPWSPLRLHFPPAPTRRPRRSRRRPHRCTAAGSEAQAEAGDSRGHEAASPRQAQGRREASGVQAPGGSSRGREACRRQEVAVALASDARPVGDHPLPLDGRLSPRQRLSAEACAAEAKRIARDYTRE